MTRGWFFVHDKYHYWVGADTLDEAQATLSKKYPDAAKSVPAEVPGGVVAFFKLVKGRIVCGTVHQEWMV